MSTLTQGRWWPHWSLPPDWSPAVPPAISFVLAGIFIALSGASQLSVALFLGIIAGGLVDMDNRAKGRVVNAAFSLSGFAFSSLCVQFSIGHPVQIAVVMAAIAFVTVMLGAVDNRFRTIAFGTLAVALYTLLAYRPDFPWYLNPLLICLGAVLLQLVTLLTYAIAPARPVQQRLGKAFAALGDYASQKAELFEPDECATFDAIQLTLMRKNSTVIEAFNQCRDALFYRAGGESVSSRTQRQLRDYFIAQDLHERLSSTHIDNLALATALAHTDLIFRLARLFRLQGQALCQVAAALCRDQQPSFPETLTRALAGLRQARQQLQAEMGILRALDGLIDNLAEVNRQLETLGQPFTPTPAVYDQRLAVSYALNARVALRRLLHHFTLRSVYFRHAVRMALIALISSTVVETLHLHLGYWILLTAVFVIQPNYVATQQRFVQRIIGTLVGVLSGSLFPLLSPSLNTTIVVMVLANSLFFYFRLRNYGSSIVFVTIQVLVGFSLMGMHVERVIVSRVIDTILGSALAWFAVSFLWPDWLYHALPEQVRTGLDALRKYLELIASQFRKGSADDIAYRSRRRRAHECATTLAGSVMDMQIYQKRFGALAAAALELLQHHYRLLGYISALGAARGQIQGRDEAAFVACENTCVVLSDLIANLAHPKNHFSLDEIALQNAIATLKNSGDDWLWEQLSAIAELLPEYQKVLLRLEHFPEWRAALYHKTSA